MMIDFSIYSRFQEFRNKKIMAVDFGEKVVGTALFTPGIDPFPYSFEKIIYQSDDSVISTLKDFINNEAVDILIFGVPYYLDGKESSQTIKVKKFIEYSKISLQEQTIYEQDETLTTEAAKNRMLNSAEYNFKIDYKKIDCLSAVIILEDFIRESQ